MRLSRRWYDQIGNYFTTSYQVCTVKNERINGKHTTYHCFSLFRCWKCRQGGTNNSFRSHIVCFIFLKQEFQWTALVFCCERNDQCWMTEQGPIYDWFALVFGQSTSLVGVPIGRACQLVNGSCHHRDGLYCGGFARWGRLTDSFGDVCFIRTMS